jgi:multidrug resistance efflux pump
MTPLGNELKDQIKKGVTLQKVDDEDMKKREEEKKKRMDELEKVKEALGAKD